MSIQGRKLTVGKTVYELEELSIERTLRLTDIIFRVLDQMSDGVQKEFADYVADYRSSHEQAITPDDLAYETEEAEAIEGNTDADTIATLGDLRPLHSALINQGIDPASVKGPVSIAKDPAEEEIIGFFLPRAYKVARPEILTLFALILAENSAMADAEDEPGGIDAYLNSIAKTVKHEGRTDDLIQISLAGFEVVKEEFERLKNQGNLPAPVAGLFGGPQASPSDEPTVST